MPGHQKKYDGEDQRNQKNDERKKDQMGAEEHSIPYKLQKVYSAADGKRSQQISAAEGITLQKQQCQKYPVQSVYKRPQKK